MQGTEFRDTANRLAQGVTEGDWRSAISRAYYGVFHHFRSFFLSHGLDLGRSGQSHFNLYSGLLSCGFPPVGMIASRIDSLREARVRADYELGPVIGRHEALAAVQEADDIVAAFQSLLASIPAVDIADGARRHLRAIGRIPP
jgi:uncharacterized protein (UPF0332 family)